MTNCATQLSAFNLQSLIIDFKISIKQTNNVTNNSNCY
jgi:hypothetical protein